MCTEIDWFPYYILLLAASLYGRVKHRPEFAKEPLVHLLEYYPAVDAEDRIERTSNFITMVFGYIVVNLLYQSDAVNGFNACALLILTSHRVDIWERQPLV